MEKYNEDYYQRGLEKGVSLYSNYRWIPELTIPLAYRMVKELNIQESHKILDYGCAMGYLVKAFRLLGFNAYGYDTSEYAIANAPTEIHSYISTNWMVDKWDWIISKDVFEHIGYDQIDDVVKTIKACSKNIFVVVPLSDNGKTYNEPAYEFDKTHIIREDMLWWKHLFEENFITVVEKTYTVPGIKDNWNTNKHSNGFFKLKTNIL